MYSLIMSALSSRNQALEAQKSNPNEKITVEIDAPVETMPISKAIIFSIGGIIAIVLGGQVVVNSATGIAKSFGVSDQLIGLTIVAIGTSLPELVTSIIAATKGESDIALGNVIGSNMFNILFVLGASAAISPIAIDPKLFVDCLFAATKGESDIALGNVIGSNMFNILFVLGASAAISPIAIDPKLFVDCLFMIGVTVKVRVISL